MNLVDFVSLINQPPSFLDSVFDFLRIVVLAAICYLAVWLSSKGKPLADEHAKKYRLWGVLYVALLCCFPRILPQYGLFYYLVLYPLGYVLSPGVGYPLYLLYLMVLKPLTVVVVLTVGEYFLLRGFAEDRKKLKKALRIQAAVSLVLYVISSSALSYLLAVILQIVLLG